MTIDAVTLALIGETLTSFVREMRTAMIRTSYSPMIHEGHDFSCAIMTPRGELLAASEVDQPTHLSALPWCTRTILSRYQDSLRDGDLFLCNDPYGGGTHLNDVALVRPLFVDGGLLGLIGVMAHWQDIGGAVPGSLSGKATEIFQEGVRIPGLRFARAEARNEELLDLLFTNVREPAERRGDLSAMEGATLLGAGKLEALTMRRGAELVRDAMAMLLDRAEQRMRSAIQTLPDGAYRAEAYLDNSGDSPEPLSLKVVLTIDGDRLIADFTGCPPEVRGPTNLGPAHATTATFTMVKAFLDPSGPINAGAMRPITVVVPEGTMLNARPPSACGAIGEVRRALEGLVMGALGRAVPQRAIGDLKGASNITTIAWRGLPAFVEFPAGGTGAWSGADGNNAVRNFAEGDLSSIQPVEAVELRWPLRVECCRLRTDSGGAGVHRGGLGLEREVRVLQDGATLSVLSDKNVIPPYGVNGGYSGAPNRFVVRRDGVDVEPSALPGKIASFPLGKDDVVVMQTAGGGGFGDPSRRDPTLLRRDVEFGYVSAAMAAAIYRNGKSLRLAADAIDTGALPSSSKRHALLAPSTAERLGLQPDTLIEIFARGPSLRAWVAVDSRIATDRIAFDSEALEMLGASPSESVAILRVEVPHG